MFEVKSVIRFILFMVNGNFYFVMVLTRLAILGDEWTARSFINSLKKIVFTLIPDAVVLTKKKP